MRAAVETSEMVEPERIAVDREPGLDAARKVARADVPGCHVVTPAAHDRHPFEEGRNEINPALICEQAVRNVVAAEVISTTPPPIGEPKPFVGSLDADEAEIEDPVLQAADLVVDHRL